MRRRLHITLLTGLACLLVAVAFIAAGTGPEEGATDSNDNEAIALMKGITVEEAERLYGWQPDLSVVLASIQESFPASYTSSKFRDDGTAVVGFAGAVPSGAQTKLDAFIAEHGVEVRTNLGYSRDQLKSALRSVHGAVTDSPGVKEAVTVINGGQIVSEANYEGVPSDEALAAIKGRADEALGGHPSGITTKVRFWNGDGGDSMFRQENQVVQHLGGEPLTTCTSAFTVRPQTGGGNESADHGILTAAHCPDNQCDDGVSLVVQDGEYGDHGDIQWMKGNQTYPDDFFGGECKHNGNG